LKPFSEVYIADGVAPGENVDVVKDIYVPALQNAKLHKRLTFSFTSQGLVELAEGLEVFIKNDGKMQLIIGSPISEQEEKSIKIAEKQLKKDETFQKLCMIRLDNLFKSITENSDIVESHVPLRLDLLTQLIAAERLKIKFAFKKNTLVDPNDKSIQHSKIAIFYGLNNEKVVWGGSANFSRNAFIDSAEEISVYKSWDIESGFTRHGNRLIDSFKKFWSNDIKEWHSCDVPSKFYDEWKQKHNRVFGKFNKIKESHNPEPANKHENELASESILRKEIILRDHQKSVLDDWKNNSYKGIVEHATGSGKTITGIFAIKEFFDNGGSNVILVVPSNLLQDQWREEITTIFNTDVRVNDIGGSAKGTKWKKRVKIYTSPTSEKRIIIAVAASASNKDFYTKVNCGDHLMVITDEVHRVGAPSFKCMHENLQANFILGLSATYKRANDPIGNTRIKEFYGKPLKPTYGIKEAIKDEHLTKYAYYLHKVFLNESETEDWIEQSKKIRQLYASFKNNKKKLIMPHSLSQALIKRRRIAKKASNKINTAIKIIRKYYVRNVDNDSGHPHRWLVYCEDKVQLEELRTQLKENEFHCSVYHSERSPKELEAALFNFHRNGGILLSIKCLDEGVNIPAADHALILASSSSKREFIQRRGRVLRKDSNNPIKIANIHDMMTLSPEKEDKSIQSLVINEIIRSIEFGKYAINNSSHNIEVKKILKEYDLKLENIDYSTEDDYEEDS
jgi:superfamily II DNA or RNA helicase